MRPVERRKRGRKKDPTHKLGSDHQPKYAEAMSAARLDYRLNQFILSSQLRIDRCRAQINFFVRSGFRSCDCVRAARVSTLDCIGTLLLLLVIVRSHCRRRDLSNQSSRLLFFCRQPTSGRRESELCRVQRTFVVECACVYLSRGMRWRVHFLGCEESSLALSLSRCIQHSASAKFMFKSLMLFDS